MTGDAFDGVLPARRGSDRDADTAGRSALERVRILIAAVWRHRGSALNMLRVERAAASQLGLQLQPGYWTSLDGDDCWALSAVYSDAELIGFIYIGDHGHALLRFDAPAEAVTPRTATLRRQL